MSYPCGMMGVSPCALAFVRKRNIVLCLYDFSPCRYWLGLGRLANFVNRALRARVGCRVGFVFPLAAKHHATQPLYDAALEDCSVFVLSFFRAARGSSKGSFLRGCSFLYGFPFGSVFREPDAN